MQQGDIVSIVTVSGEYVGEVVEFLSDNSLRISNPRMILTDGKGQMGFAKGICVTGIENPEEQIFMQYVFIADTNSKVVDAWKEATSQIITPPKPTLVK
tara:strand:- start:21 stop:317 length:297 start_codon:yes stop_codon:yes gene_type:complete